MYDFFNGVTKESVMNAETRRSQFDIGDNLAKIDLIEFKTSSRGNTMLVLTLKKDHGETLKHYIVDNEFKLGNLKMLYQCFNIPVGDVEYDNWVGRSGVVSTKLGEPSGKDNKRYPMVNLLVPRTADGKLPPLKDAVPWEDVPQDNKQAAVAVASALNNAPAVNDSFDDDIPF